MRLIAAILLAVVLVGCGSSAKPAATPAAAADPTPAVERAVRAVLEQHYRERQVEEIDPALQNAYMDERIGPVTCVRAVGNEYRCEDVDGTNYEVVSDGKTVSWREI